jgi:membrane-bound lytic murein transglycosylase B
MSKVVAMGLFDQIVGALNDPDLQANTGQLESILNTVQQTANSAGVSPDTTEAAMSMLGGYVRSALQQQRMSQGQDSVQEMVNKYGGTGTSQAAVNQIFSPQQQEQVATAIAQRTGINANTLKSLLPILVPLVLNLLQTGTNTRNPRQGNNPVLSGFLDADGDGDVDIADAMRLAGRYLNK